MHEVGILCLGTKCPKASGSLIYTTGRQALSGAKAIATRTLPLCTQDHMAALLPQGRRNRGAKGGKGSKGLDCPLIFILEFELTSSQSRWAD